MNWSNVKISSVKLANTPHATNDKDDVQKEPFVGEQAVDAEHSKDNSIVA